MTIREDDLSGPEIQALVAAHLANSAVYSPPEAIHALNADGMRAPGVTVWSAWENGALVGMGGLKALASPESEGESEGEIKAMHTAAAHRGKGVAAAMLGHLIAESRRRGYRRLWLETGVQDGYAASRRLYARHGFVACGPFADYVDTPHSVFMTLAL
ncbi:MAG: GNAT family N-acetyltransferase [Alphaproteobacteria bacterium]|nr:GNAT family N-acetyltransferase [Alphaproteobacteria bacterium]MCB9929949.1 GNAT family N-acetyltransferase [Alphaproteobacteria bacterium]